MPDTSISALTAAAVLDGTEVLPIVQSGSTVKTTAQTVADLAQTAIDVVSNALSVLQVSHDTLSNRVSANSGTGGSGSVTSDEVSIVGAGLSARIDTVSNLASAHTVSITALSNRLSAVTVRTSVGGATSIKGLQSALDTLSTQISNEVSIRTASVQTASAAATSVDARVNTVSNIVSQHTVSIAAISNQLSAVTVRTSVGGATSIKGLQSALNTLSTQISNEASIRAVSVNTASAAATSIGLCVNAISNQLSGLTTRTSSGGTTSTKGLQSALNNLSTQISNELSVRTASVQTASAAATSVDARVNTVSNQVSVNLSAMTNASTTGSLAAISLMQSAINTVSNLVSQHTVSLAQLSNAVSALNSGISSRTTAGASAHGLQSAINNLSARISQINTGAGTTSDQVSAMIASVASTSYSVKGFSASGSATVSVKGIQSVLDRISNNLSNSFSAGSVVRGRTRVITATVKASVGTALTDIAGTTVALSAGLYYEYHAQLLVAMSAANALGIGATWPAMSANCAAGIITGIGVQGASAWQSSNQNMRIMGFDEDASGSIILSLVKGATSVSKVIMDANWTPTANGNVVLQYRASVSTSNVKIMPGSFVRLFRLVDTGQ